MRILLLLPLIAVLHFSNAQVTIAGDWTKTGCNGGEHHLYSELDSGFVVLMEIVMLDGCMPCITAAHNMEPFVDYYNAMYDNRVRWYSFGYNDTYPCEELNTWQSENAIPTNDLFVTGSDLAEYYGGMGMPSIIVCGRNTHTVYYNHFGYIDADSTAFKQSIEYALGIAEPTAITDHDNFQFSIFPNPVSEQLNINTPNAMVEKLIIYNAAGQVVNNIYFPGASIDISGLTPGVYTLQIISGAAVGAAQFIKQ